MEARFWEGSPLGKENLEGWTFGEVYNRQVENGKKAWSEQALAGLNT